MCEVILNGNLSMCKSSSRGIIDDFFSSSKSLSLLKASLGRKIYLENSIKPFLVNIFRVVNLSVLKIIPFSLYSFFFDLLALFH
jgi:hypothetical protein